MKAVFASIALFAAGALAQLTINTPSNVVECQPTLISWSGGTGPYTVSVVNGATPNGAAIESFPSTSSTSYTWTVNIQANTNIGLNVRDSTGTIAQSASFVINAGTSTDCLNTTSVSSGPTVATSAAASTAAAGTTGASPGTTAASSASASATSSSSSSGASANIAQFGAAGVVGAAIAALFL